MSSYSSLVGQRVTACYRAGRMHLYASGMLVSDTGEMIYLEERFSSSDRPKTLRVSIPYSHLIRIEPEPEKKPSAYATRPVSAVFHKSFPAKKP